MNAFAVSSKNADMLQDYLTGRHKNIESGRKRSSEECTGTVGEGQGQQASGDLKAGTSEYDSDDTHPFFLDTHEEWPQFTPVESMRNGVPYHRLQLEQKMRMLEFLLDQLLTIDFIAAEFTRREVATSCFDYPYGALPTKNELESLENEDECGLCGLEGELLCCDGCIRSYHRQCIGMKSAHLTDDKWLCSECSTIDPCQFGPLRGGRKSSLDWFTLSDVKVSATIDTVNQSASLETNSIPVGSTIGMAVDLPGANSIHHAERDVIGSNAEAVLIPSELKDSEFLVVHGFLFSRPLSDHRDKGLHSMDTDENWKDDFRDWLPATRDEVYGILQGIGCRLSCSWPLYQIPLEPSKVWSSALEPDRSNNFSRYFLLRDSFDPSSYFSLYRTAPLPRFLQVEKGSKRLSLVLSDFESECNSSDVRVLSNLLTRDMSQDHRVAMWLKFSTQLFSPYQMISLYLVRLESSFRRGCLLGENWGIRKGIYKPENWSGKVTTCSSIQKLAKKMVHLVDACHSRVFLDSWFDVSSDGQGKSESVSLAESSDPRTYGTLPIDWTADVEMACRRWQRALDSNILSLLSGTSIRFEGSVEDGKPTMAQKRGRKERKDMTFERQRDSEETRKDQKKQPSVADDRDKKLASPGEGSVVEANRQANVSEASASVDRLYAAAKTALEECSKEVGAFNTVAEPSTFNVETTDANVLSISHPTGLVAIRMPGNLSVTSHNSGSRRAVEASNNTEGMAIEQVNLVGYSIPSPFKERATLLVAEKTKSEEGCPLQESPQSMPVAEPTHVAEGLENGLANPSPDSSTALRATFQAVELTKSEEGCPPKSKSAAEQTNNTDGLETDQVYLSQGHSIATPMAERSTVQTVEVTTSEECGPSHESPKFKPAERTKTPEGFERDSSMATPVAERSTFQTGEGAKSEECPLQESSKLKPAPEQANATDGIENDKVIFSQESSIAGPISERATIQAVPAKSTPSAKRPSGRPPPKEAEKLTTRTRRSGRLHRTDFSDTIESLSSGPCVSSESVAGEKVLPGVGKTHTLDQATRLEHERRTRLAKLGDLIANPTVNRTHWPVAGRKLFDPVGYLPPSEMRRLGRNAGVLVAPYVRYSSSYEVGEVSVYHSWRKRSLKVRSFEDLLMQIRVLDSFIDKPVSPSS
jgi:hypothetical protein